MTGTTRTETPIFTQTFDLLAWLLRATNDFPRAHRFSLTQGLLAAVQCARRVEQAILRHRASRLAGPHVSTVAEAVGELTLGLPASS